MKKLMALAAAVAAMAGCATWPQVPFLVATGEIRALLLHLGHNMWYEWFPSDMDRTTVAEQFKDAKYHPFPDAELHSKDFYTRCPKSVVQSNWFYDSDYGGFEVSKNETVGAAATFRRLGSGDFSWRHGHPANAGTREFQHQGD